MHEQYGCLRACGRKRVKKERAEKKQEKRRQERKDTQIYEIKQMNR